ncbi:MAG: hydroxymethylbilane synthase [Planctomycetota bacterium]|nr:hydroxymethylbilane synthase [Planctomycetota bacterium]
MSKSKPPLTLRLGTRASNLALTQSRLVARLLERAHRKLGLRVELVEITSTGDKDQTTALKTFGGAGVFVKELERALLDKRIDFAVHSLKDMPVRQPRGLLLAAVPAREDVRDVAVTRSKKKLAQLPAGAVIGTGSPRRRALLALAFPQLAFGEIRGNVETRLRKVREGACAGTILARAGLKRLGLLKGLKHETLSLKVMLPAPGQGALGIECRAADARTRKLLRALHDPKVFACVTAERACLAALGGGCHLPLGAHAKVAGRKLALDTVLATPDGQASVRVRLDGPLARAEFLGRRVAHIIKGSGVLDELRDAAKP